MHTPVPTIGRVVHYCLTQDDADKINRRRTTGASIADRIKQSLWPVGAQAHIGNDALPGQVFPATIVRVLPEGNVNLQVQLDGTDNYWATTVAQGPDNGDVALGVWYWPTRA